MVEWVQSRDKKTTSVIFPLKKHTSAILCLSHATNKSILRHFKLARIVANLIQKLKTQSSALTSRYADGSNDMMTLHRQSRWRHFGLSLGAPNNMHDVTEVPRRQSQCTRVIQPCNLEKYCTVGLHAWQRQKFGRNVWIKLFSRVWNWFHWCSTDRSPN
jgi:hypothetical protein